MRRLLQSTIDLNNYEFEYIFTDNHSEDQTFPLLRQLCAADQSVHAYHFSRNLGYQKSIMTGYSRARGVAAIQLDVDLQDPPELMSRFLGEWESGADVVYGVRIKRQEHFIVNCNAQFFID